MKKLWPVEIQKVSVSIELGRLTQGSTWESTSPMGVDYSVHLPPTGRPGRPVSVQNTFLKPRDDF